MITKNAGASFWDVFSQEFLDSVYSRFESYLNQPKIGVNFSKIVEDEILQGLDWENTTKILANLKLPAIKNHVALALENHAYRYWFPVQALEGRKFTRKEKAALAALTLHLAGAVERTVPVYETINWVLAEISDTALDIGFDSSLRTSILAYNEAIK